MNSVMMNGDVSTSSETSSSSSSDSNSGGVDYEVFLSFCGEDTRKSFTDVLYNFLQLAGVCTFRDNEDLPAGEMLAPALLNAIKQSKISIPIFSKNYAFSKWCLLELVQMVQMAKCEDCKQKGNEMAKCKKCINRNNGHTIIPIFYDVGPDDVKLKTEIYNKAFCEHMENFDLETVQQWKAALKDVASLKGLELKKQTNGYEGQLAKEIVEKVLQKLKKSKVKLPDFMVGMEYHIEKLEGLLSSDCSCVRIVGIHGMGGIGKTTIAKVMYNKLLKSFKLCCFLENVREGSMNSHDLVNLQTQIISNLARGTFCKIVNVEEGREKIKDIVKRKKVLLVLDDIDQKSQFDIFIGNPNLLASGSRIIVTTRNKEVLDFLKATYEEEDLLELYEPPLMNDDQSLKLFSYHAFNSDMPPRDFNILSRDIASTALGLPMALESIGKSLRGNRNRDAWNAELRGREKIPHEIVIQKLKRSFEVLCYEQQHIFLDIACLFIGEHHMLPSYMWTDCELYPQKNVNVNVLRSLIKIREDDSLWMHPQLRDLGRQIVREENMNQPGERSRLWHSEEALDIFDRRMGTNNVLALCLDLIREEDESRRNRLVREDFGQLRNLRFLKVGSTDLQGDFKHLFSSLRWLQWKPLGNISPTNFGLKNLVILDLSESQIMEDWEGWSQIKMSKKLKVLNLSQCDKLGRAPDLSKFESLERLILRSCHSLGEIQLSVGNLINLRFINFSECMVLSGMLDFSQIVNLEYLNVRSCLQLRGLSGLKSLVTLRYLNTSGCHNLETLPSLSYLGELKELNTSECKKLIEIQGLDKLESLEYLDISGCLTIKNLPNISNLKHIKEINISRCRNLAVGKGIWGLESLETLDVSWCTSQERTLDLSNLKNLKKLNLAGFGNFIEILGLEELKSLETFNISQWKSIQDLPDLSNLKKLKELKAYRCAKLSVIRGLEKLEALELVVIAGCNSLQPLTHLQTKRIVS